MNTLVYGLAGVLILIVVIFLFTKIQYGLIKRKRRMANIQRFDKHIRVIEVQGQNVGIRPKKKKMFFHVI